MQYKQYILILKNAYNTYEKCNTSNTYPDVAGDLLQVNCMPIHTILIDTDNTDDTYHILKISNTYKY